MKVGKGKRDVGTVLTVCQDEEELRNEWTDDVTNGEVFRGNPSEFAGDPLSLEPRDGVQQWSTSAARVQVSIALIYVGSSHRATRPVHHRCKTEEELGGPHWLHPKLLGSTKM